MTQPRSARPSRSSRPSSSSQRPSAPRLSALHLPPDSLGYALDGAARAITAVSQGSA
ncbi:16S rRNA (cytosine(967)-C(5))-methyltransferase RsmB, partial [Burkholderia sp. Tr-860]|nr:16S rRNA (cytosine(967)-C(5))-methyltransferase RsmB [Burkholderia sp. Tr-860]